MRSLSSSPAAAAKVNGAVIPRSDLDAEVRTILANQRYIAFVESRGEASGAGTRVRGTAPGTADATFVTRLLGDRIVFEVIRQDLAFRKVGVTSSDRVVARSSAATQAGGEDVFTAFPTAYQDTLVRRFAESIAYRRVALQAIGNADIDAYYAAHPDEFAQRCVRHIQTTTIEQAVATKTRLDAGTDFAALAALSTDAGSAAKGGDLGCVRVGVFPQAFEQAVATLPIGVVSDPVQTESGFHLIRVDQRRTAPLDDALRVQIKTTLEGQADIRKQVLGAVRTDRITVDPRFGVWRVTDSSFGIFPVDIGATTTPGTNP